MDVRLGNFWMIKNLVFENTIFRKKTRKSKVQVNERHNIKIPEPILTWAWMHVCLLGHS